MSSSCFPARLSRTQHDQHHAQHGLQRHRVRRGSWRRHPRLYRTPARPRHQPRLRKRHQRRRHKRDGAGWYLDANPNDHAEFAGNILNGFAVQATATGPANDLNLYSLVTTKFTHALGITNVGSPDWTGNSFITNTGVADSISTPGTLWTFSGGASGVQGLLTSNNGGAGGTDTGNPLHVALHAGIPAGFVGAIDVGNASYSGSRRWQAPARPARWKAASNIGSVSSLTINGLDGNDTINVSGDLSFLGGGITITGDGGNDTLTLDLGSGNSVPAARLSFNGGTEAAARPAKRHLRQRNLHRHRRQLRHHRPERRDEHHLTPILRRSTTSSSLPT